MDEAASGVAELALRTGAAGDVPRDADDFSDRDVRAVGADLDHRTHAFVAERERAESGERGLVGDDMVVEIAGRGRERAHERVRALDEGGASTSSKRSCPGATNIRLLMGKLLGFLGSRARPASPAGPGPRGRSDGAAVRISGGDRVQERWGIVAKSQLRWWP